MPFIASVHASKWTEYLDHEYLELKKVSFQRFFSTQMIYTVPKKNKLNKHTTEPYLIFGDQIGKTKNKN